MADRAAEDEIRKPEQLQYLCEQYEVQPYDELALMIEYLDAAREQLKAIWATSPKTETWALETFTRALDEYRRRALAKQSDLLLDECDEAIVEDALP